ncbi:MAG: flagellar protein export ATPase FliI [Alphaproteobacteria bacterium]|nr:flagellar protein export ATPase FliI [Alphaproteobacteria bacterium]
MQTLSASIQALDAARYTGRVAGVQGLNVDIAGLTPLLSVGARLAIPRGEAEPTICEVVGFRDGRAVCLPYGLLDGVQMGAPVTLVSGGNVAFPDRSWLGRIVDAMGRPLDGGPPLRRGSEAMPVKAPALPAHERGRVGAKIDLGVRALNTFLSCCVGQRLGIFAGSGVGKSVLMSMLARWTQSDVNVIALIGERGREVKEFLEDDLGAEGLARSIVVVATSDEPALKRRQAAYLAMTLAEYFRDGGARVLLMMDSLTRFAMAQREIGLAAGEPPTTKGYTPTVFSELPRLLERAGPGRKGGGTITGLFTVLVDGDDHNEPIADAVRGILDGHVVMERAIAERGRYPAINILKSVSRTMPACNTEAETALVREARALMATYTNMEELIRVGAYRQGTDPEVDRAIRAWGDLEAFLTQGKDDPSDLASGYAMLAEILARVAR